MAIADDEDFDPHLLDEDDFARIRLGGEVVADLAQRRGDTRDFVERGDDHRERCGRSGHGGRLKANRGHGCR